MIPIIIRALTPSDTETIEFIKERISSKWELSKEEVENKYIKSSFAGGFPYIFTAFTENGEFAGKIFLTIEEEGFLDIRNEPWISALFVQEKFRRQGIAKELIKVVENKCRSLGYKKLYLDTIQAVEYYRKLGGWQEIGTDIWLNKEVVTVMVKEL